MWAHARDVGRRRPMSVGWRHSPCRPPWVAGPPGQPGIPDWLVPCSQRGTTALGRHSEAVAPTPFEGPRPRWAVVAGRPLHRADEQQLLGDRRAVRPHEVGSPHRWYGSSNRRWRGSGKVRVGQQPCRRLAHQRFNGPATPAGPVSRMRRSAMSPRPARSPPSPEPEASARSGGRDPRPGSDDPSRAVWTGDALPGGYPADRGVELSSRISCGVSSSPARSARTDIS